MCGHLYPIILCPLAHSFRLQAPSYAHPCMTMSMSMCCKFNQPKMDSTEWASWPCHAPRYCTLSSTRTCNTGSGVAARGPSWTWRVSTCVQWQRDGHWYRRRWGRRCCMWRCARNCRRRPRGLPWSPKYFPSFDHYIVLNAWMMQINRWGFSFQHRRGFSFQHRRGFSFQHRNRA